MRGRGAITLLSQEDMRAQHAAVAAPLFCNRGIWDGLLGFFALAGNPWMVVQSG